MAECTIARCSQERRFFRKELQRWSRDVLYVVGLERVAEELMGAGRWKTLTKPFRELETTEPEDWNPEDICYFCNSKKQPPYDPASGVIHGTDGYNSFKIDGDDLSTSSDQGVVPELVKKCSFPTADYYVEGSLLPWYTGSTPPPSSDQPLDLSMHSSRRNIDNSDHHKVSKNLLYIPPALHNKKGSMQDSPKKSVLKVPQIPVKQGQRKRLDPNSKRSYTEEELQAALRDIQSGKLGTRRAAVIYGIPRSTLRNKVYKLAMERNKGVRNNTSKTCNGNKKVEKDTAKSKNTECTESEKLTSSKQCSAAASASESLRQLLKNTITQKTKNVSSRSNDKHKSDTNQFHSSLFYNQEATAEMLSTLEYGQALAPFLSQIISNIQHVALAKYKESYNNPTISALKDDLKLPLLHDLIRCLMEERLDAEREQHHSNQSSPQESSTAGSSLEDGGADSSANVILKIPSYKPAKSPPASSDAVVSSSPMLPSLSCTSGTSSSSSHGHARNKGITVSLKELIARSINQRVNNSHLSEDGPPSKRPHTSTDTKCTSSSSALSTSPESHKQSSLHYSSSSADNSKSEKRTRPKRGRYRNYDRDNLARAVRAVQRGEMSVHRAGTYFGVPHSTLEYKVKERHLLRPRKRDSIASSSSVGSLLTISGQSSATSTVKTTESSTTSVVNCKTEKDDVTTESTELQNGLKALVNSDHFTMGLSLPSQLSLWQSMPFFSMDFSQLNSNNFFASQMMRKLQENARLHEEAQRKQKNQEIGLLETLIKSSLERSISPNDKSSAPALVSAESSTVSSEKTEDNTEETADDK